jgi:hypothetical protein
VVHDHEARAALEQREEVRSLGLGDLAGRVVKDDDVEPVEVRTVVGLRRLILPGGHVVDVGIPVEHPEERLRLEAMAARHHQHLDLAGGR